MKIRILAQLGFSNMHLLPKELDKLQIYTLAQIALDKLKNNHRLNIPLTVALLTWLVIQEIPHSSVVQLMSDARQWIGKDMVMFGVVHVVDMIQVEGTFPDGTKLVTIHHPICEKGNWKKLNLKEVKLPFTDSVIPGECIYDTGTIILNENRRRIKLKVINTGDRPIQVGSHFPFAEANPKLKFNRFLSINMHLDVPSGTSVRFEPGQDKIVQLCTFGGNSKVTGANLITPILQQNKIPDGYLHSDAPALPANEPVKMDHKSYAEMYGATTNDKIRLGDTNLFIQIEKDFTIYGDESIFGGGKSIREGQMQTNSDFAPLQKSNKKQKIPISMDLVITNVIVVDYTGIYKADIGIIGEEIRCIGKSGNPDISDCDMLITSHTEIISGEHLIITSGAVDTHVHFISIQQCDEALFSGITTMIGGGTGPATGTCATTCTPGISVKHMLQQTDHIPMNLGFTGKGNSTNLRELKMQIDLGCIGLKLHEDWGTTPATIDACLQICQQLDVQCSIHTDTLNESGFVEQTIKAINNRTIHTYHTEGAGGGHAPDIITLAMHPNVIPSSTNPTRCLTKNTIDEHLDMLMVCHHLNKNIKEDLQFAESRIRKETIAAEDVMHDLGILSIISSDSQAMGRIGEVICRTWQTAHKMKLQRGFLTEKDDLNKNDNDRIKRYVAKYTINPAIAHGISHLVGNIEVGKIADLVLWDANAFGVKPRLIIKQGKIVASQMGDANASIPTCQPIVMRQQFGFYKNGISFVSKSSLENVANFGLSKRIEAVSKCNSIGKKDMKLNDKLPKIRVNPDTFQVFVDDVLMTCEEVDTVPLCTLYQAF